MLTFVIVLYSHIFFSSSSRLHSLWHRRYAILNVHQLLLQNQSLPRFSRSVDSHLNFDILQQYTARGAEEEVRAVARPYTDRSTSCQWNVVYSVVYNRKSTPLVGTINYIQTVTWKRHWRNRIRKINIDSNKESMDIATIYFTNNVTKEKTSTVRSFSGIICMCRESF